MFLDTYKQNAITFLQIKAALKIYDNTDVNSHESTEVINTFREELNSLEFTPENIKLAINNTKEKTGAKGKELFMPIRLVTTYQEHGPELAKAIYLFGEKLIKERLK